MKTILFQGDSITDCTRSRDENASRAYRLSHGYAGMVAGELELSHPNEYLCYNRGVSGNRIVDIYARINIDIINLKPDVMSILCGINDVWHEISRFNGVNTPKFERIYGMLIEEVREALPDCKIMILEPFVLPGTATCDTEEKPNRLAEFRTGRQEKAEAARRVAQKYGLTFVPLQAEFERMAQIMPADMLLSDGVHPNPAGHTLIKNAWLAAYEKLV